MRRLLPFALVGAVAVTAASRAAVAQDTPAPRERQRVYSFFGPDGPGEVLTLMRRGRLGVTIDMRADPARDTVGALVAGVTPGGAADRAGVRAGDVVVRFNGTRLAAAAAGSEDGDSDQSRPALRLISFASRLDPGDTVRLEVRRDNRPQTFTFQAEQSDMDVLANRMAPMLHDLMPSMAPPEGPMRGRIMVSVSGDALSDLELVKVNPGLGEYFGTAEGLLVANIGSDSSLGLRSGDVILTIGGRRPASPVHAMRILSTYDAGENVQFDVMRQRRRVSVTGRMPASRETHWRARPNNFVIPMTPLMPWMDEDNPRIRIERSLPGRIETKIET